MDELVKKLVALGIPGLVLLVAVSLTGFAGGAAIVTALAFLGGPFGMLGGIALLGVVALASDVLAHHGIDAVAGAVIRGLRNDGVSKEDIINTINGYPITEGLKRRIRELVNQT